MFPTFQAASVLRHVRKACETQHGTSADVPLPSKSHGTLHEQIRQATILAGGLRSPHLSAQRHRVFPEYLHNKLLRPGRPERHKSRMLLMMPFTCVPHIGPNSAHGHWLKVKNSTSYAPALGDSTYADPSFPDKSWSTACSQSNQTRTQPSPRSSAVPP